MSPTHSTEPVIIGFDGSATAEDALCLGLWAAAASRRRALVVNVYAEEQMPVLPGIGEAWSHEMKRAAEVTLARARRIAGPAATEVEFRAVPGTSAAQALDDLAVREHASGIVAGSSRRGPLRRVASSHTADRLLQGAVCSVLVAPRGMRDRQLSPLVTIGCAYLPTPEGRLALRQAAALARRSGARLNIFTVPGHGPGQPHTDGRTRHQLLEQLGRRLGEAAQADLDLLPGAKVPAEVHVLSGGVVDALAALDDEDCQILVCGSRGYGPLGRVLLGGVSSRLVRRAATPVLVVPRGLKETAG